MTRGIIMGVFPDKMLVSTEFNGDMSPESYGSTLLDLIDNCNTEDRYEHAICKFDYRFFRYGKETGEPILHRIAKRDIDFRDYSYGYCDYQYLSNHTGQELSVTDRAGKPNVIPDGETAIYHYCEYLMTATEAKQQEEEKIEAIYRDE